MYPLRPTHHRMRAIVEQPPQAPTEQNNLPANERAKTTQTLKQSSVSRTLKNTRRVRRERLRAPSTEETRRPLREKYCSVIHPNLCDTCIYPSEPSKTGRRTETADGATSQHDGVSAERERGAQVERHATKKKKARQGNEGASTAAVTTHLDVDQIRVVGRGRCRLHPGQRGRQLPKQGLFG